MRKDKVKCAEKRIMQIVKGKKPASVSTAKIDKLSKFLKDKVTGKRNPPRLLSYGEFVDLVQERREELGREMRR